MNIPGTAILTLDTNNDAICDRSQSNPQSSSSSTTSVSDSLVNPSTTSAITGTVDATISNIQEIVVDTGTTKGTEGTDTSSRNRVYYVIPVIAIIVVPYSITWVL